MAPQKPKSAAPSAKNTPTANARAPAHWSWKRKLSWRLFAGRKRVPCCFCRRELAFHEATLEHIVPRSQGGWSWDENLEISCWPCNQERGVIDFGKFQRRKAQSCAR